MATVLTRSLSSTSTSWTFSAWVKKQQSGGYIMSWGNSGTDATGVGFSGDKFIYYSEDSPSNIFIQTTALYRDVSGWYHVVCKCDAGAITLYVNGESAATGTGGNPLDTSTIRLGDWQTGSGNEFFGLVSHLHFIDGTAYDADSFGSTDSTTGQWKINTNPSVSYGTNGFFLFKDDNSVNDQSGNGNNFTLQNGTLTQTEDNPSNVFATLNAVNNYYPNNTLSNGNTSFSQPASTYSSTGTTLGMVPNSGKFYAEMKCTYVDGWGMVGIFGTQPTASGDDVAKEIDGYAYLGGSSTSGSAQKRNNATNTSYDSTFTTNDIISVAVDLDNYKIYFGKNGTWLNSGDPTSGSTGTGAAYTISQTPSSGAYFFGAGNWDGDQAFSASWNFGNGYFGTTAVSSAGTNASGNGIFEYDVPSGYTALSTKGLNT